MPPLQPIAVLLVDLAAELRCLLARYRHALDDFRTACDHQTEFRF
jgi:hypothetical protein